MATGTFKIVKDRYVIDYTTSVRILKTKYLTDGLDDMLKDYPPLKNDEFLVEQWDNIQPLTLADVLKEPSLEKRRGILEYLRLQYLVYDDAEVVDTCKIITKQKVWNREGILLEDGTLENVYHLVRVHASKLFPEASRRRNTGNDYIYAVKVVCPTTGHVFYINVSSPTAQSPHCQPGKYSALNALASLTFCPITNPKSMYRQGDIFIFRRSRKDDPGGKSEPCTPYPLTGEQFVKLMVAQS